MGNQNYSNHSYISNIDSVTKLNKNYRKVIHTTAQQQLVVMSIKDNIPSETHPSTTQFIRIVEGNGVAILNGITHTLAPETIVIIPAGTRHEIKNTHKSPLKLYTIYSPPEHPPELIQKNKP